MFHLNHNDRNIIQRLVTKSKEPKPLNADSIEQLAVAPDVYVALPRDDIPRLLPGCEPGTGSVCGTGSTESGSIYAEPGVAICDLYRIVYNHLTGDPELKEMLKDQKVYNLDTIDIADTTWILVVRTKWGSWIAIPHTGVQKVKFELLEYLEQFPQPIVPVMAARRHWIPSLNNNHGGWRTDCNDIIYVADYNEVGYNAGVGGFGDCELHQRIRTPQTVGTITDLCCLGEEMGVCLLGTATGS